MNCLHRWILLIAMTLCIGPVRADADFPVGPALAADFAYQVSYVGCVTDGADALRGTVEVKAAKPDRLGSRKVSATMLLLGEKKISFPAVAFAEMNEVTLRSKDGSHALQLSLGTKGLAGTLDGTSSVWGALNLFAAKDDDGKLRAEAWSDWKPAITVALKSPAGIPFDGWSSLTLQVGSKGSVRTTGRLADGTSVSASAKLLLGEEKIVLPVVAQLYQKKAGGVAFLVCVTNGVPFVSNVSAWDASTRKTSPFVGGAPSAIRIAGLEEPADGDWLFYADPAVFPYLPIGVSSLDGRWKAEKDNAGKLNLSYAKKSGQFKGSFRTGKASASVFGVTIGDGIGYGTAVIKNIGTFPVWMEVAE